MQGENRMCGEAVFHIDILNEAQKKILPVISKALSNTEFYMAGGTALALQVGHRQSLDFDWFIPKLGDPEALFRRLKSFDIDFKILSVSPETVYLILETVQMSFIGYDYPELQPKILWPEFGLHLAGLNDIACMKISAIASRGSRKDFVDLFYLVRNLRIGTLAMLCAVSYILLMPTLNPRSR